MSEWLFFGPLEDRIVRLLLDHEALSRDEIARHIDELPDGKVKTTLAGLVSRRVLIVTADGYALNVAPGRREEVRGWLGGIQEPS